VRRWSAAPGDLALLVWRSMLDEQAPPFVWTFVLPFALLLAPLAIVNLIITRRKACQNRSATSQKSC